MRFTLQIENANVLKAVERLKTALEKNQIRFLIYCKLLTFVSMLTTSLRDDRSILVPLFYEIKYNIL